MFEVIEQCKLKEDKRMGEPQTSVAVKKTINNNLISDLPYPTYEEQDIEDKAFELYEYFRNSYKVAS